MSLQPSTAERSDGDCCGIQVDFYEVCGHVLTLTDHFPTCTGFKPSLSHPLPPLPSPTAQLLPQPGPSSTLRSAYRNHTLIAIPDTKPKCFDLHTYIRLIQTSCPCTTPLDIYLYPENINTTAPTRSDPHHDKLPKEIILERRLHYLNQHFINASKLKAIRAAEISASLAKQREKEVQLKVSWRKRVFIFDPKGEVGDFFEKIEVKELRVEEKVCCICQGMIGQKQGRRLPCGCVFDLGCVVGWMRERKDCPVCARVFKLVAVSSVRGEEGCREVDWEDDLWSESVEIM